MKQGTLKVGSLDDPVWREPAPATSQRRVGRGLRQQRIRVLALVVVLAAVLVTGGIVWSRLSRPGGDPGNNVYPRLRHDVISAVPAGASDLHMGASTAVQWDSGCVEIRGARSGWSKVYISIQFVDTGEPRATALEQVAATLKRQGWVRHDVSPGPKQGKVPHWLLDVHQGALANAFAFANSTGQWFISASWQPPGPVGQPCP